MRQRTLRPALALATRQPLAHCPAVLHCHRCLSSLRLAPRHRPNPNSTRPRLPPTHAALVPTSPPLHRIPPSAADTPVTLRPPHFLKQFFLRVHPDLFHAPFVRVQHSALVTDEEDGESQERKQQLTEPITIVTAGVEEMREAEVSSATMRQVNESSVARLNELMQYYKQLQSLGESTPLVLSLPRPPADSSHFAFYCKHSTDEFTYLAHRYTPVQTLTPIVAIHAIDAFLTRLLLSAGVALPSSLVAQWKADWAARKRSHRYERIKRHMPWMMDETRKASDERQREIIRRDYDQIALHANPLTLTQRVNYAIRAMHGAGLVQVSEELGEEERVQGTMAFGGLVGKYADQLQVEEWLGSVVRIGTAEEGYGWEVGTLRLPYNMTQKRVWETCQEYVRALKGVEEQSAAAQEGTAEPEEQQTGARQSSGAVEDREQLLSEKWAKQCVAGGTESDPEWQMTAQEVRERQGKLQQAYRPQAQAAGRADSVSSQQRKKSVARQVKPKLSSAEWARQLDLRAEQWLQSKVVAAVKDEKQMQ